MANLCVFESMQQILGTSELLDQRKFGSEHILLLVNVGRSAHQWTDN